MRLESTPAHALSPLLALLSALLLAACSGGSSGGTGNADAHSQSEEEAFVLPVKTTDAARGDIPTVYRSTSTLETERQVTITARVTGIVEAIRVEEGDLVEVGDVLLEIQADEYRLEVEKTAARLEKAEIDFARVEDMRKSDLLSAEEYDAKKYELDLARAESEQAILTLSHTRVVSPFTGKIIGRHTEVGQLVSPPQPLFEIGDFSPLRSFVHVPSREMRNIRAGQKARLVLDSDGTEIDGKITLISPVVDASTGTVKVTVEIDRYPGAVRPGDFATVEIITDVHRNTILVPRESVLEEGDLFFVYVVEADSARRQAVEIGYENDVHMEVLSGLATGDKVVVSGQNSLREGDRVEDMSP